MLGMCMKQMRKVSVHVCASPSRLTNCWSDHCGSTGTASKLVVAGINGEEKIGSSVSTQNHSNLPEMETTLCHSLVDKIKGLTTDFRIRSELSLQDT